MDKYFDHIVHGGDYNPDQWIKTPEIWDEDVRLMKLSGVNSATVGIFAWSLLEPEEGVYNFEWLDTVMDKLYENGIDVILATPSGARPPWMAEKYPEVLRVEASGMRNDYGVRHNHCLTSPVYREKVREINRRLAERYGKHPALKMWHVSNEYSGDCHCPLCREAFREWLKEYYHNDLEELNDQWWNGFWAHRYNSWSQIDSPTDHGENHVSAMKLCWKRFVTDATISFFENEIAPLRELTPDIPITTNLMRMHDGFDYQKLAKHLDIISWDNYPAWGLGDYGKQSANTAFVHDVFRSMKGGKPFFMMESTPSIVNWHPVNKLPKPGMLELSSVQAVAYGADSVQYFQWRKSRGGHEKYHGAVVDHCGHENTRVFREVAHLGEVLGKLGDVTGGRTDSSVAVICDWENSWATKFYCGFNNTSRDYFGECEKWYTPFYKRGIPVDLLPMDADISGYDLVIAPYLYMLKPGTADSLKNFVKNGGTLVSGYLTGLVDKDDRCWLRGFPGDGLSELFGLTNEETDSLPANAPGKAVFGGREYSVDIVCDLLTNVTAKVLGEYASDFYAGTPALTVNDYGKGKAYYVAFRNDGSLADDLCAELIEELNIPSDAAFAVPENVAVRRRGELLFVMNFSDGETALCLDGKYADTVTGDTVEGEVILPPRGYLVLK